MVACINRIAVLLLYFMKICLIFSENLPVFRLKPLNFSIEFLNRPNRDARKFEREHAN